MAAAVAPAAVASCPWGVQIVLCQAGVSRVVNVLGDLWGCYLPTAALEHSSYLCAFCGPAALPLSCACLQEQQRPPSVLEKVDDYLIKMNILTVDLAWRENGKSNKEGDFGSPTMQLVCSHPCLLAGMACNSTFSNKDQIDT